MKEGPSRTAVFFLVAMLAGCSTLPQIPEPEITPEPTPPSTPSSVEVPSQPEPEPQRRRIAILLSDDVASYSAIANQITPRMSEHDYIVVNLDSSPEMPAQILEDIKKFDPDSFVAIGLLAARWGRKFADIPMVFCQVFNYSDHDLLSPKSRGVKLLPPFALQLKVWKEISPDLRSIGMIIGPNQEDLIAEIENAAQQHNVQLLSRTVASDKEALYALKLLTPQIQGFWLLPDNRVLSPRVLREMLSYGRKYGNQTAVFSPQLLGLGADISFSSSNADVADAVLNVLGGADAKKNLTGPPMTSLTTLRAQLSPELSAGLRTQSLDKLTQFLDAE